MKVGDNVRCIWTQRRSKAYAKYGAPAQQGAAGQITVIHELRDVTIIQFCVDGVVVYAHVQDLMTS